MFIVANRVPVASGWEAEFEARFRMRIGQVEKNPGFVRMEVMRPLSEGSPYVVQTVWRDRRAFDDWLQSEDFKTAHANPMPQAAFTDKPQMDCYEVAVETVGR